jgi:hypothetical protein
LTRVRDEAVGESEIALGLRIVGALDREIDRLAMPLFAFGVDVVHVRDLVLVHRRRSEEQHQVMPLLRRNFRGCARLDQSEIDVVDDHLGVVLLSPFLGVSVVEPFVVSRHEVAPL